MSNLEAVVVPFEVVPLVHVNARVLVGHNLVEEALGLGSALVLPDCFTVTQFFVGVWKTSLWVNGTCLK